VISDIIEGLNTNLSNMINYSIATVNCQMINYLIATAYYRKIIFINQRRKTMVAFLFQLIN